MTDQEILTELRKAVDDMDMGIAMSGHGHADPYERGRGRAILRAVQTDLDILRKRIEEG